VEGERLKPGIKRPLAAGAQIKLAEVQLIFDGNVQRAAPTPVAAKHTDPTRVLTADGESKSAHPKSGPTRTDQKIAEAKAEAKLMEAKLAAEAKLAEAQRAADAKLAAARIAAEARLAEAKIAEAKSAEAKASKKAPDPTETYVRPQSSDLFFAQPDRAGGSLSEGGLRRPGGGHLPARDARSRVPVRAHGPLRVSRQDQRGVARARVIHAPARRRLRQRPRFGERRARQTTRAFASSGCTTAI
jgi:multidrug efflux pump subunit AcrA (membrane-fusion protein)